MLKCQQDGGGGGGGVNQGYVSKHMRICTATILLRSFRCVTTPQEELVIAQGQASRQRPPQTKIDTCCSDQMDVPESINIILKVMLPIVFWNMIVSVVVVSWCGQVFTMMIILPW